MDAREPGLGGSKSWPRNRDLGPQALVYEGPRPACPSLDSLGLYMGGMLYKGWPTRMQLPAPFLHLIYLDN